MKHMRIIVGVDGSPEAQESLQWAQRLAAAFGGEIVVVHALGMLERLDGELVVAHQRQAQIEELVEGEWCASLRPEARSFRVVVQEGDAVDVLLDVAAREDADLLVMGSRGVGATPALALGSTSLHVLQLTSVPTLIVPEPESSSRHLRLRRILVAVDGSPVSLAAVDVACRFADALSSEVSVVEALEDVPPPSLRHPVGQSLDMRPAAPRRVGPLELERLQRRMRAYGVPIDVNVHRGAPNIVVPRVAASMDADLVMMGCHRGSARGDLLSGSVSRQVVGRLDRPALVVPDGLSGTWSTFGPEPRG